MVKWSPLMNNHFGNTPVRGDFIKNLIFRTANIGRFGQGDHLRRVLRVGSALKLAIPFV